MCRHHLLEVPSKVTLQSPTVATGLITHSLLAPIFFVVITSSVPYQSSLHLPYKLLMPESLFQGLLLGNPNSTKLPGIWQTEAGMPLNILQCTGQFPRKGLTGPKVSSAQVDKPSFGQWPLVTLA